MLCRGTRPPGGSQVRTRLPGTVASCVFQALFWVVPQGGSACRLERRQIKYPWTDVWEADSTSPSAGSGGETRRRMRRPRGHRPARASAPAERHLGAHTHTIFFPLEGTEGQLVLRESSSLVSPGFSSSFQSLQMAMTWMFFLGHLSLRSPRWTVGLLKVLSGA